jgi:hypothetical protein
MFHDFDPYQELMQLQRNQLELVNAINEQSGYLKNLTLQHQQLIVVLREMKTRIHQLEKVVDQSKKT